MPMTSNTLPSSTGPISELPYDVLIEIFTRCLPRYPLHQPQPNIKTAPILLCHVCSTWRRLALASTTLWTHLSYSFSVKTGNTPGSTPWTTEFKEKDIEFIRWWKTNHGQIPPFLSFIMNGSEHATVFHEPTNNNSEFLLEYLTSAQYLQLDTFWDWLHKKFRAGHPLSFPHLHTALVELNSSGHNALYYLPAHAFPALRRLSLDEVHFPANATAPPAHWATLTHISLHCVLALPMWRTLLRAFPHLSWGHFDIAIDAGPSGGVQPAGSTLPALHTLLLVVSCTLNRSAVFPLSYPFIDLHLPGLRTLSLSVAGTKPWEHPRALSELYTVLASAPAVTRLAFEDQNLALETYHSDCPPVIQTTLPIWHHTPHLAHIQFSFPVGLTTRNPAYSEFITFFVYAIFSSKNTWLDIQNTACPINKVTISNGGEFLWITTPTMPSVEGRVLRVFLGFTEDSVELVAADEWKEWGSGL